MACLRFLTLHVSAYVIRTYIHKSDFNLSKNSEKVKNFVDHFVDHLQGNGFAGIFVSNKISDNIMLWCPQYDRSHLRNMSLLFLLGDEPLV